MYKIEGSQTRLRIGRTGENEFRTFEFDVSEWVADNPAGVITGVYRRPDNVTYPVVIRVEGGTALWTVTSTELAVAGGGEIELRITAGEVVGKSRRIPCIVSEALELGEKPPAPGMEWVDAMLAGMEDKLDANWGAENAGRVMTVGEDGNVTPMDNAVPYCWHEIHNVNSSCVGLLLSNASYNTILDFDLVSNTFGTGSTVAEKYTAMMMVYSGAMGLTAYPGKDKDTIVELFTEKIIPNLQALVDAGALRPTLIEHPNRNPALEVYGYEFAVCGLYDNKYLKDPRSAEVYSITYTVKVSDGSITVWAVSRKQSPSYPAGNSVSWDVVGDAVYTSIKPGYGYTDSTLLKKGAAADAAAVGDKFKKMEDKLDANWGAENAGRVMTVGEDGNVTPADGIQPDLAQNDAAASDYVKNRTHYVDGEIFIAEETVINASAQETVITLTTPIIIGEKYMIHWGDTVYECKAVDGSVVEPDSAGVPIMGNYNAFTGNESTGEPFFITAQSLTCMIVGLGEDAEIAFSITKEDVRKLDNKYLDLDWIPKKESTETEILPDTEVTTGTSIEGNYFANLIGADYVKVMFDGVEYRQKIIFIDDVDDEDVDIDTAGFGNLNLVSSSDLDTGEPFFVLAYKTYMNVILRDENSHTISLTKGVYTYHQIPEEYIPDGIARVGDSYTKDEQIEMLIEADMLPATTDVSGAILTDSNGNIILRY